jgi:D-alanyl-D-alanine carboxypeptidase
MGDVDEAAAVELLVDAESEEAFAVAGAVVDVRIVSGGAGRGMLAGAASGLFREMMMSVRRMWVVAMMVALVGRVAGADAIDDYVKAEMEKKNIPGVALAVVKSGEVIKLSGYGLGNVEHKIPVTAETVFQIQSITKTFTAIGVLMLVEEGKLKLEDAVSKHLERTPDSWREITLRHLLTHTSGIKDFINEPTASLRLEVSEEQVLKATAPRPLNFQPGEKYAYSNTNYHLLAMIIRKQTRKAYGEFLKERIFEPLGMKNTRIMSHSEIISNRAAGYLKRGNALRNGEYVAENILAYGGGGIISTATDMAKYAAALGANKVLKKALLDQAWVGMKLNDGSVSNYGLGWGTGQINGHRHVGHSGAHMTGFTSSLMHYVDDGLSVVVLTNANHGNPGEIAKEVAGLYDPALKAGK